MRPSGAPSLRRQCSLDALLGRTRMRPYRGDALIDEGTGINVLDGPLHASRRFN